MDLLRNRNKTELFVLNSRLYNRFGKSNLISVSNLTYTKLFRDKIANSISCPSRIKYFISTGGFTRVVRMEYYFNGKLHKEDGPAVIEYREDLFSSLCKHSYYFNGKLHRLDGPASIIYYRNGNPKCKEWYRNGIPYNKNGPTNISYRKNGTMKFRKYQGQGWERIPKIRKISN